MMPLVGLGILFWPFLGVLFFMGISFVRLDVLTWHMVDARFALMTSILTLAGWLLHFRSPGSWTSRMPGQFWWYFLTVLMMSWSAMEAEASTFSAWQGTQKFWKYLIFIFLMIQMTNSVKRLRMVQEVIFWGINFLVLWGFQQYFAGNHRLERVGGGDFADSSALAALFILVLPMAVYRFSHPNKWMRLSAVVFTPFYLVDLVFTESRSGFLGLIAAAGLIFLRSKYKLRALTVAGMMVLIALPMAPDSFWERIGTIGQDPSEKAAVSESTDQAADRRSSDQRLKVWAVAVAVIKDKPILGVGRHNFGLIHWKYAAPIWYGKIPDELYADLFLRYRVCHNMYLDMLASGGLLTFIPWMLLLFSVPYSLSRARRRLGNGKMDVYWRHQSYGLEAGLLGYMVTGLFQDLGEVEAFYWVVMLAGIMCTIMEQHVAGRRAVLSSEGRTAAAETSGIAPDVTPGPPGVVHPGA